MDVKFKCSKCNGELIKQKTNNKQTIYVCKKCNRQTTQTGDTKIVDMDINNDQILYG